MDNKEYNRIFLNLRTISNLYKSNVTQDELMIVESFLTLMRKENALKGNNFINKVDLRDVIFQEVQNSSNEELKLLFEQQIEALIKTIRKPYLEKLYNVFHEISDFFIKNYCTEFFDQQLNNFFNSKRRLGSDALQPKELTAVLNSFRPQDKEPYSYYNPFAGLASLSLNIQKNTNYLGEELDSSIWILAKLRLLIYDTPVNFKLENSDSILSLEKKEKYDFICFNPPFNLKLSNSKYDSIVKQNEYSSKKNANTLIFSSLLKKLNPDGKMVFVVPDGFLTAFNRNDKSLRKHLVDSNLLDKVISLPQRIYNFTGVKSSIIVLSNDTKRNPKVQFVDASDFIHTAETKVNKIDLIRTLKAINGENSTKVKWVAKNEIIRLDYSLAVDRYMLDDFDGVYLEEFASIIQGDDADIKGAIKKARAGLIGTSVGAGLTGVLGGIGVAMGAFAFPFAIPAIAISSLAASYLSKNKGKVIKTSNLKNDRFDFKLNIDQITVTDIPKSHKMISESCILLSNIGGTIKPNYFKFIDEPIFIDQNITALKIDENVSRLDYIVNEFHSPYILDQIKAFTVGSALQSIRKKDILRIKFLLPSIQEQKIKVEGAKQAHMQNLAREFRLKQELLGLKEQTDRNFKSVLHTMRQYLNALKTNVGGTSKFIEKYGNQEVNLNTIYSKNLNQTFGEHLTSLEGTITSMTKLLDSYENKDTNTKSEVLRLESLVEEAQNRFKNPDKFRFEKIYIDYDAFSSELGYQDQYIDINKEDFFKVFSNIVYNAINHGFTSKKKNYIIRTAIFNGKKNNEFILEISNNGEALPENFTYNDLITRGEKSTTSKGSGTGGSDIKNILSKYKAHFELISNEKEEFPVKYILHFPQNTIIDRMEQLGYQERSHTNINLKENNNE